MKIQHSHVQLPCAVLKQFCDNETTEKKVWALYLQSGDILKKPARHLGTESNYFSATTEQYLNSKVESQSSRLFSKIRKSISPDGTCCAALSEKDEITLKCYIKNMMARSELARYSFISSRNERLARFWISYSDNDLLVRFYDSKPTAIDTILSDMRMVIVPNQTRRYFVVPRNAFYTFSCEGGDGFMVPISPKIALALVPEESYSKAGDFFRAITDEQELYYLNKRALTMEFVFNEKFVASCRKSELEELAALLKRERISLEKYKASMGVKDYRIKN